MTTTGDESWPTADDDDVDGPAPVVRGWLTPPTRQAEPAPVDGSPDQPPNGRAELNGRRPAGDGGPGLPVPDRPLSHRLPSHRLPADRLPPEPQPSEPHSPEPRPSEPRPSEPRPSEPRPSEPRPSEPRPSEPRPSGHRPEEPDVPPVSGGAAPAGPPRGQGRHAAPDARQSGQPDPASAPAPGTATPRLNGRPPLNGQPLLNGRPPRGGYLGLTGLPPDDRTEQIAPLRLPPDDRIERIPPFRPPTGQPDRPPQLDPLDGPTEAFGRPADLRAAPLADPAQPVQYRPGAPAYGYPPPAPGVPHPGQRNVLPPTAIPGRADAPALPHPGRAVVRRRQRRRRLLEWPFLVVFSLLAALVLRTFVVQTFYIPSESMHDTLLEGDRVLVNKLSYHFHDLRRGDVVVFRRPANIDIADDDLIKRVVALPGEQVEGHDRHVYVNNRQLDEPYVQRACGGTADFPPVTVPAGHVFVMGDNRCDSTDSRVFGPIDAGLVVGRAFVVIWPADRIGWL